MVNSVQFVLTLFLNITLFVQIRLIFNNHETDFTNLQSDETESIWRKIPIFHSSH